MKRYKIYILSIIVFTVLAGVVYADSLPSLVYQEQLEKRNTKMVLYVLELSEGEFACVLEVSKKSASKIDNILVKTNEAGEYKISEPVSMPWGDLKAYFNSAVAGSGSIVGQITKPRDRRNTAHMGYVGIEVNSGLLSDWVTAGVFKAPEKTGDWQVQVKYNQDGKKGKIKSKSF